jgi:hypothetical protein
MLAVRVLSGLHLSPEVGIKCVRKFPRELQADAQAQQFLERDTLIKRTQIYISSPELHATGASGKKPKFVKVLATIEERRTKKTNSISTQFQN